jgi:hypothetical protein
MTPDASKDSTSKFTWSTVYDPMNNILPLEANLAKVFFNS